MCPSSLYCGDCLSVMNDLDDKSIDMVLADLPFGVTQNTWDKVIPFDLLWKQYKRICKPNAAIVLMGTQPFISKLITSNIKMFRYDFIWHQNKSTGFLNAKIMPLRKHCHIAVFYNKTPIYNPQKTFGHKPVNGYTKHTTDGSNYGSTKTGISGGGSTERYPTSVLNFPVVNNDSKEKFHPTQKPVSLGEYFVKTYTNAQNLVLDNACGSGSFLVAAKNLDRRFIGIDIDQDMINICKKRLEIL